MTDRVAGRLGDLAVVAVLLVLASPGWAEVYGGRRWMVTVAGALVLGLGIAWLGARSRWPAVVLAAVVVGAFAVLGAPLALPGSPVPTPGALRALLTGAVGGWWDVLTLAPPVGARGHLLVPALIATLVAAVLAGTFALRLRQPWPALLPPAALLAGVGLLGTSRAVLPVVQGVLLVGVSLAWVAWRQRRAAGAVAGHAVSTQRTRALVGAGVVLAVAAAAGTIAPATAAPDRQRFSLREVIQPPLDPRAYASPLIAFRKYVKLPAETALFTVDGLPEGARIRLATLDTYDGVVWQVAPPNSGSGTGNFLAVGESTGDPAEGDRARVEVTVEGYSGVWVPTVGQSSRIDFGGPNAQALTEALGYNAASGTALTTRPLGKGDRYVLDAVIPSQPSDAAIGNASPAPITLPDPQQVPPAVVQVAGELVAGATTPVAQARALQDGLAQEGFFSNGLEGQATSRAGHGADRIAALLAAEQLIGDHEQYAATMALMARSLGLPARVVMGFVPEGPGPVTVTGDHVSAWVEVAFAGHGWVTFDPTPDESRVPQQEAPKPRSEPRPQVQQPPPPVQEPDEPPPASEEDRDARDADEGSGLGILLAVLGYAGLPLLVLLAPCLVLLWLKRRRRRRRARTGAPSTRIAGGWAELVDTARDLGVRTPSRGTRRETARVLDEAYERSGAVALAERADAGVFAPGEPTDEEVARFWAEVDESLRGMSGSVSRWRRLRARLSLASLRGGR